MTVPVAFELRGKTCNGVLTQVNGCGSTARFHLVGKIFGEKILLGEARNNSFDPFLVFDADTPTMNIAAQIFDFEQNDWVATVNNHFEDIAGSDLLVLKDIQILPGYRGQSLGQYLMKDFHNNFISGAGLFLLECYPTFPAFRKYIRL